MSEQQAKRQRVSDLLCAGIGVEKAAAIVNVSVRTAYNVQRNCRDGKGTQRFKGSGGHNRKPSAEFLDDLRSRIDDDPTTSMRTLARQLNVDQATIKLAVPLKSYVRSIRHLLTDKTKETRLQRCLKVLRYLKANGDKVKIYSGEKIFTLDAVGNRRNDRYLAKSRDEVKGKYRTKHPQKVMIFGVVASDGKKMAPYFFKPGEKVDATMYYKVLRYEVLPWLKSNYPCGNYVWTQDGAPCHTSRKCQDFCRNKFADFWPADMWPSSSPDINPLDFTVWGVLERESNKTPHPNLASLKASIKASWNALSEAYISKSCQSVRGRIEAIIANKGGHIE